MRGADHVDGLEVFEVLTGAAQQRRAVDGRLGATGRAKHIIGIADVALDQLDADRAQRRGLVGIADQGTDMITALDQLLTDIAAGLTGGTGDEDCAGHLYLRLQIRHIDVFFVTNELVLPYA